MTPELIEAALRYAGAILALDEAENEHGDVERARAERDEARERWRALAYAEAVLS